jgi:hypothetical protein
MRSIPTPGRRQKRLLAIALAGAALLVAVIALALVLLE